MQATWKRERSTLRGLADWYARLGRNARQGTSAPTLGAAWAGWVELSAALGQLGELEAFRPERVVVEAESHFDEFGGPRNHDLVVHGTLSGDRRMVVCVEAKAGEDFGQTVGRYREDARRRREAGTPTNAPARLERLLERFVSADLEPGAVDALRYQLLSALAGTIAEAEATDATDAVLMIHEFRTDQRSEDVSAEHEADLRRFFHAVFDDDPPAITDAPWCVGVRPPVGVDLALYVVYAMTDLRGSALRDAASGTAAS